METRFGQTQYKLAIPVEEYDQYMKLQIADCFVSESYLHITVNVPMVVKNGDWILKEVIRVPYKYENQVCYLRDGPSLIARNDAENMTVAINQDAGHCDLSTRLCHIPYRSSIEDHMARCHAAMTRSKPNFDEINKHCVLECSEATGAAVKAIAPNVAIVANAKEIFITCTNGGRHRYNVTGTFGAHRILCGCGCGVYVDVSMVMKPPILCEYENYTNYVTHVIPTTFSKFTDIGFDKDLPFLNGTHAINFNWNNEIPHINISGPSTHKWAPEIRLDDIVHSANSNDLLQIIWLTILTGFTILLVLKQIVLSGGQYGRMAAFGSMIPGAFGDVIGNSPAKPFSLHGFSFSDLPLEIATWISTGSLICLVICNLLALCFLSRISKSFFTSRRGRRGDY